MSYEHRCIIVPEAVVLQARAMSAQFPSAQGMYARALALAAAPTVPVAYISAGPIATQFADLLPLTVWSQDAETGAWTAVEHRPGLGQPVAESLGVPTEAVQAILDACDVSEQTAEQAMGRRGLVYVPDESDGGGL